jgi:peptidyl-prolyl cis-trans isomerase SurA
MFIKTRLFLPVLLLYSSLVLAQGNGIVDQVMAVVGSKIILKSDVEKQYAQAVMQGNDNVNKCEILDQLLVQKLLLNQAAVDSVIATDSQVESELDKRMRFYIKQIGSEQKLEEYFHSTIVQLKAEMREALKDQITVQMMQSKITKEVSATPNDVRVFFENYPKDSIPLVDAELEVAQIVRKPPVSEEEKKAVKEKLTEFRNKIIAGEDFAVYAALYSADNTTAKKGGELGFFERGQMVPEFEAAAFNLKEGEVSPIIETKFGYHILLLIERRGNQINVRHILLQPKISDEDLVKTVTFLDSIRTKIIAGAITFEEAAEKFSDDEETKNNGGALINPETGTTKLSPDKMDKLLFFQVDTMKLNQVSKPIQMVTNENKTAYRLVLVKSRTEPHKANLKDDYQKIQEVVLSEKQNKIMSEWVEKKRKTTYVQLNDTMNNCEALKHWTKSNSKP